MAEGDPAFGQIVGGQLHGDLVPGKNTKAITAEAAGQVRQHHAVMLQLDTEQSTGKFLKYRSSYFNAIFFAH